LIPPGYSLENPYDSQYKDDKNINLVEPYLLKFLKPFYKTVLDLGCGEGRSSEPLAKISGMLYCTDPSLPGLKLLKKRKENKSLENIILLLSISESLPFPDGYFDLVASITVIEHISNPIPMLKEVRRVLRSNGEFLIRNDAKMYGILERLRICRGKWGRRPDATHINMITPAKLRKLLESQGFKIIDKAYFPFVRYSKMLNLDLLSAFATKGQFLCRIE